MGKTFNPKNYLIEVFYSEEDQAYIAMAPDLPGCSVYGECLNDVLKDTANE